LKLLNPRRYDTTVPTKKNLWLERTIALFALANLGIVIFDLSYIPWRNLYFRYLNPITKIYDPIKGIEPHRETTQYLATVDRLKQQSQTQGWQSANVQKTLQDLNEQSTRMIETNPFQLAGKTGALEKIKNRMRDHMGQESARRSFQAFWQVENLQPKAAETELSYFDRRIRPLIDINYFRETGEDGDFVDNFWWIDLGFITIFGLDLWWRLLTLHRRSPRTTWREALFSRWYDLFLLSPWFRLLRIVPVTIRLHQAALINLSVAQHQLNSLVVNEFADELTQVVVTQVLNQAQGSIKNGAASKLVTDRLQRSYVDLNNVNEVEAIAQIVLEIAIYRVLPKIQPDLEEIADNLLQKALADSPAFQGLRVIPGFAEAPHQLTGPLVRQVSDALYIGLTKALSDPDNGKLARRLAENFTTALGAELQKGHTVSKLESLLADLLEEVKVSYVHADDLGRPEGDIVIPVENPKINTD
jgi:hypothetical protein